MPSSIDPSVTEEIPARHLHMELDDPPPVDDVREAIDGLQCRKSVGPDGIPPEVFLSRWSAAGIEVH